MGRKRTEQVRTALAKIGIRKPEDSLTHPLTARPNS